MLCWGILICVLLHIALFYKLEIPPLWLVSIQASLSSLSLHGLFSKAWLGFLQAAVSDNTITMFQCIKLLTSSRFN